jgi:hypothetical protein
MKAIQAKAIIAIPIILMVFTFFYSNSHFADKGCDGGTCSVYLLVYSVPLVLGWLFSIGGTFLIMRESVKAIIVGIILCFVSLIVFAFLSMFNFDIKELKTPLRIGIYFDFLLIIAGIFFAVKVSESKNSD